MKHCPTVLKGRRRTDGKQTQWLPQEGWKLLMEMAIMKEQVMEK